MAVRSHVLRPGTPVLTRSPGVLQVGLSDPSIRLPDAPDVRRLLDDLAAPRGSTGDGLTAGAAAALDRLREASLVVPAPPEPADPALTPLVAQFGSDALRRRAARASTTVEIEGPAVLRTVLDPLLVAAGLRPAGPDDDARVRLVLSHGPVPRDLLDPLVRASVPHLVVTGDATAVRIGPFVDPGRTACLRCVDAHESLHDQRLPLLLAQAARQCGERPPPRDPLLDHLALAWAVRDLTRFVEGDEPSTWSTTVDLGAASAPVLTRWGRHPYCGCSWDGFLDLP